MSRRLMQGVKEEQDLYKIAEHLIIGYFLKDIQSLVLNIQEELDYQTNGEFDRKKVIDNIGENAFRNIVTAYVNKALTVNERIVK